MARSNIKLSHRRNNSNKNKKMSVSSSSFKQHQDLEDKFSRMSISPSKTMLSRLLLKTNPSVKPTRTPKDVVTKAAVTELEQRRLLPLVPPVIYYLLQDIVAWTALAESHKDDFYYELQLKGFEATLHQLTSYLPRHMPKDWKYERATAGNWGRIADYHSASVYRSRCR